MLNEQGGNEFYSSKTQQLGRNEHTKASSKDDYITSDARIQQTPTRLSLGLHFLPSIRPAETEPNKN
jgi:hypothetical protein